jgi:hypothetical protein
VGCKRNQPLRHTCCACTCMGRGVTAHLRSICCPNVARGMHVRAAAGAGRHIRCRCRTARLARLLAHRARLHHSQLQLLLLPLCPDQRRPLPWRLLGRLTSWATCLPAACAAAVRRRHRCPVARQQERCQPYAVLCTARHGDGENCAACITSAAHLAAFWAMCAGHSHLPSLRC